MTDAPTTETPEDTAPAEEVGQEPADVSTDVDTAEQSPTGDTEPEVDPETADVGKLRGEAAKWRAKLRDTEAERDTLRDQLAAAQRGHVEHLAAGRLSVPGDVWIDDATVDALLDAEGHVDPDLVDGHLDGLLERRPGLGKPGAFFSRPRSDLLPSGNGDLRTPMTAPDDQFGKAWGDVLNPRR